MTPKHETLARVMALMQLEDEGLFNLDTVNTSQLAEVLGVQRKTIGVNIAIARAATARVEGIVEKIRARGEYGTTYRHFRKEAAQPELT